MSQVCELTGTRPLTGHRVSHSNIKTKHRSFPNLQKKSYFIPELSQKITVSLSTQAVKTVDKQGGLTRAIMRAKVDNLSLRLKDVRKRLAKARGHKKS